MIQNPDPDRYQAGVALSVRWSTVGAASSGWNDLKIVLRTCGWLRLQDVWLQEPDSSFHVQATAVPLALPSTKATTALEAMQPMLKSLKSALLQYETEQQATLLSLTLYTAYIAPDKTF